MPHSFNFWMVCLWSGIVSFVFIIFIINHFFLFGFSHRRIIFTQLIAAVSLIIFGVILIPVLIDLYMS